jgi:hypothetical protein
MLHGSGGRSPGRDGLNQGQDPRKLTIKECAWQENIICSALLQTRAPWRLHVSRHLGLDSLMRVMRPPVKLKGK